MPAGNPRDAFGQRRHHDPRVAASIGSSGPYAASSVGPRALGQRDRAADGVVVGDERRRVQQHVGHRARRRSQAARTLAKYVRPFCDLPVQVGEQNGAPIVEAGRERREHFSRPIAAAIERRKIAIRPATPAVRRSSAPPPAASLAARRRAASASAGRDEQRDHEMRRQVEDVRVADVVAEREDDVGREEHGHQHGATRSPVRASCTRPATASSGAIGPNCCRRSNQYIAAWSPSIERGTFITIVSRQSDLVTSNQNVRERVEHARQADAAGSQSARRFQMYCSGPDCRARGRQRDDAGCEQRSPAARRGEQQKQRVGRRQQNHRQVVAEAERVGGEEQRQTRSCRPFAQRSSRSSVSATSAMCSA